MIVEFEEKDHIYSVNGDIASISVTELLKKHGLSPNYDGVNKQALRESAEKGKDVHKDLENVLNEANYEPKTEQGKQFAEWVKNNLDCGKGEQMLGFEEDGFILAGTADVMAIGKNKAFIVADHKNTSVFHREYVSWQVSLLDYMARQLGAEKINGKLLKWKGASEFYCFHYDPKTGNMKVYELEKVPDEEIRKLITCEKNGELYQRPVLVIDKELQSQFEQAEQLLIEKEKEFKQAETTAKEIREKLCKTFEEQGIKSWETDKLKVTYVAPVERVSVDSRKLKEKYPVVFGECQKLTKVKSSVRVSLKEEMDAIDNLEGDKNGK